MNELTGVIADASALQVERRVAKGGEGDTGEADVRGHPLQVEAVACHAAGALPEGLVRAGGSGSRR